MRLRNGLYDIGTAFGRLLARVLSRSAEALSARILLASCIVMMPGIGSAHAQGAARKGFVSNPRMFLDSCPPGHRIEFQSGASSLYVDPHWFDGISLSDLANSFENRCPIEPVLVPQRFKHGFFFGREVLAVANTPANLGSSYFRLITGFIPRREDKPFPGAPREPVQQPTHVDVTTQVLSPNNPQPRNRVYELRYPNDGTESSTTVRVSCSGGGPETFGKRSCFTVTSYDTPYRYRGTLSVRYTMEHPYSTETAQSTPAAATIEAEGILAFDMRIRAWIDSMMKKP